MVNCIWIKQISKDDIPLVGGKAANLGELASNKFPVPGGFVVTAEAYKLFLDKTGIQKEINEILEKTDINNTDELKSSSEKIQDLILSTDMPPEVKLDIQKYYKNINTGTDITTLPAKAASLINIGRDLPFVAARSSATAEDLPEASFAGQQATYLNIKGQDNVVQAVHQCWASLYTARAIYYRETNNFEHAKVYIAVVVQKMVNSEKSGVMFTIDPVTNDENKVIIEAGFGLGDAIVSGAISPNRYVVDKNNWAVMDKKIPGQDWMFTRDINTGRTKKQALSDDKSKKQVLSDGEIVALAKLSRKIEKHYGNPQDIEYAVEDNRLYIVQTRAVTTQKKVEEVKEEVKEEIEGEVILEGLSASPGVGSGPVKIVHGLEDLNKIEKEDVLVTKMTNPDMVPAMERASAIVTDEGGSTCLTGDTKILTNEGFVDIKNIIEDFSNKKVLSLNRNTMKLEWKNVVAGMKRKSNLIEINSGITGRGRGNCLRLTPDHKMITLSNRKLVDKKIEECLSDGDSLLVAQKVPKLDSSEENEDLAYLTGALSSDGYIHYDNRRGKVVFTQKNIPEKKEFIDKVCRIMKSECGTDCKIRTKSGGGIIRGREINGFANDYSWHNKQAAILQTEYRNSMSLRLLSSSDGFAFNYLAGIIDGDGSYNHSANRINIYCAKEDVLQNIVISCMKLGIVPQVTVNRTIHNIQIVERVDEILNYCSRVKGNFNRKNMGTRFFNSRQLLGDIIQNYNVEGKIKPYVDGNLLIDSNKIKSKLLPLMKNKLEGEQIKKILNSDTRMLRCNFSKFIGEDYVYNLTVEDNHNFVVFTDKYTPIILNNCHAAIVSRELGIPAVVGTEKATEVLKENSIVSVDGSSGKIYSGKVEAKEEIIIEDVNVDTVTKIKVNVDLPQALERAKSTNPDGVGLVRLEFMIAEKGVHPAKYIRDGRQQEYTDFLASRLKNIAQNFEGKPVWVRTSDIRSDEYRELEGGDIDEKESNPMMGWHAIRRGLDEQGILKAELKAVKKLKEEGVNNIAVMLPLVTHVEQVTKTKEVMKEVGLECDLGIMVETPAAVEIIDELASTGIKFASIGSNDLTQFVLAVDRNNAKVQSLYNELHPAVLKQIKRVVKRCKELGVESSICGQAGSSPEMAKNLVKFGIDSISANIDAVGKIKKIVAEEEKKMLLDAARRE